MEEVHRGGENRLTRGHNTHNIDVTLSAAEYPQSETDKQLLSVGELKFPNKMNCSKQ